MNYPTIGGWRGKLRADIEAMNLGVRKETETLVLAKDWGSIQLPTLMTRRPLFWPQKRMYIIICHLGMTVGGPRFEPERVQALYDASSTGKKAPLDEAVDFVNDLIGKIREINKNCLCFAHGGPISTPEDTQYIYDHTESSASSARPAQSVSRSKARWRTPSASSSPQSSARRTPERCEKTPDRTKIFSFFTGKRPCARISM